MFNFGDDGQPIEQRIYLLANTLVKSVVSSLVIWGHIELTKLLVFTAVIPCQKLTAGFYDLFHGLFRLHFHIKMPENHLS